MSMDSFFCVCLNWVVEFLQHSYLNCVRKSVGLYGHVVLSCCPPGLFFHVLRHAHYTVVGLVDDYDCGVFLKVCVLRSSFMLCRVKTSQALEM